MGRSFSGIGKKLVYSSHQFSDYNILSNEEDVTCGLALDTIVIAGYSTRQELETGQKSYTLLFWNSTIGQFNQWQLRLRQILAYLVHISISDFWPVSSTCYQVCQNVASVRWSGVKESLYQHWWHCHQHKDAQTLLLLSHQIRNNFSLWL